MLRPTKKSTVARNFYVPMGVDRGTGALRSVSDVNAHLKSLLLQLLLTDPGERVMRAEFGTGLRGMVFEPLRDASAPLLKAAIYGAVETHLGDVIKLEQVKVQVDETTLNAEIIYATKLKPGRQILNFEVPL